MRDISIEIKNLYYKYPDGYEALKHIDLTLYKGESLGIVGPNGAGKSTLLLQLTGINRPSSGKIEINSLEVNKKTDLDNKELLVELCKVLLNTQ